MLRLLNGGIIYGTILIIKCRRTEKKTVQIFVTHRLSEGFANLLSYQTTGILHPEWQTRHFFNIRALHSAFRFDAGNTTRSMTPTPSLVTPAQIRSTFDTIAYEKCKYATRFKSARKDNYFIHSSWKCTSNVPECSW